ncbi:hypothetical protein [Bradyrhizobium sp. McL0616]|uniref:hypothetical protein n=1 Tax=Bradyrhizobium sp. McL0616 TaxID=3415674 RepID=UPI003CF0BC07
MKIKLSAITLLAMIVPGQARTAMLTDAEAAFLDQLVTAAAVLEQRCLGHEVSGTGGVQLGATLLGSTDAAMAMINACDAAIKAHDGRGYDPNKFRPKVSEVNTKASRRIQEDLIKNPKAPAPWIWHGRSQRRYIGQLEESQEFWPN